VDLIGVDYYYWLGRVQFEIYNFEEAFKSFNEHRKTSPSSVLNEESSIFEEWAKEAQNFYNSKGLFDVKIEPFNLNTGLAELSPFSSSDGKTLIYRTAVDFENVSNKNGSTPYFTEWDEAAKKWNTPSVISEMNGLNVDNSRMIAQDLESGIFFNKNSMLYKISYDGNRWGKVEKLDIPGFNKSNTSQFYITPDADRIIFSMDVGNDNMDLFEIVLDESSNSWSDPMPLQGQVNTLYYEDSPFLSEDGMKLYFSSNGTGAIGGYDIFVADYNQSTNSWVNVRNLGYPFNSIDDDFEFSITESNKGYFSSNRLNGKGQFDIYSFQILQSFDFNGIVYDQNTNEIYTNAVVEFTDLMTNEKRNLKIGNDGSFKLTNIDYGNYNIEIKTNNNSLYNEVLELKPESYNGERIRFYVQKPISTPASVLAAAQQNEDNSEQSNSKSTSNSTVNNSNSLNTTISNELNFVSTASYEVGPKLITENVYFAFSNSNFSDDYFKVLNKALAILKKEKSIRIEVGGHTDKVGSSRNNLRLSQKRADRVKKWLIDNGIKQNRIIAKGYGENQPLASNDDEVNGRELNRRIEIRLVQ
jgi:outer membrane protein OmpA-like peptidoglycan-associated protein